MKKKILIVGISIIGIISILPFIKKDKLIKENIPNNYNTELAVNISEDGTNYNIVDEIPTTGYELNNSKSICKTQNETSGIENAPKDTNITIEYKEGKINFLGVTKQRTRCYLYFDKKDTDTIHVSFGDIEVKKKTPNFSKVAITDEGIFKAEDGVYGGTSYYWRGAATTNHVIFANKCWRIVRINGNGTTRLIYNGPVKTGNTCTGNGANADSVVMGSTDAEKYYATIDGQYNNSSYVGWTYSLGSQRTTSGTASNAKTQTEKWYNANITGTNASKVADGKFCNDRNVGQPMPYMNGYVTTWSATGTQFAYAGVDRLWNKYQPTLSCPSGDVYTLKAGAITADEVEFAGGKNENNLSYYLYNGQNYWTMSPYVWYGGVANVFSVHANGYLNCYNVHNAYGLRPVINLKADTQFQSGGNGTLDNPYVVL